MRLIALSSKRFRQPLACTKFIVKNVTLNFRFLCGYTREAYARADRAAFNLSISLKILIIATIKGR
jgi:hypothetical protein